MAAALMTAAVVSGAEWVSTTRRLDGQLHRVVDSMRLQGWEVVISPAVLRGRPWTGQRSSGSAVFKRAGLTWGWSEAVIASGLDESLAIQPDGRPGAISIQWSNEALTVSGSQWSAPAWTAERGKVVLRPGGIELTVEGLQLHDGPKVQSLLIEASLPPGAAAGAIQVLRAEAAVGPMRITGHARIDRSGTELDGMVRVTGWREGLDHSVTTGLIEAATAQAASAILDILAAPSLDNAAMMPIRVDDAILSIAGFPLHRVGRD